MNTKNLLPLLTLTALSLVHSALGSAITGLTNTTLTTQTNLVTGALTSDSTAFLLAENTLVTLGADLTVGGSGSFDTNAYANGPINQATILAGTTVDSYLLHFNPVSSTQTTVTGSVSFDGIIYGVIYTKNADVNNVPIVGLAGTDLTFGLGGSTFTTNSFRGIFDDATDAYSFVLNGNTLDFTFSGSSLLMDEIRILVDPLPEPIHFVMAGVAAMVLMAVYRSRKVAVVA